MSLLMGITSLCLSGFLEFISDVLTNESNYTLLASTCQGVGVGESP